MWDNLKMKRMFLKNGVFICGLALALGFLYLYGCGEGGGEGNSDISSPETPSLTTNPDLVVASPSVSNSSPIVGTNFTLSVAVRNDGDGASGVTTLRYYHSTDTTVSTSDTEVGTDTVTGLTALGSASGSVELTARSTPGTYYYGACVDAVEEESDTTNNCSSSVEVNVLGSQDQSQDQSQGTPDLVVISPSVSDSGPTAGTKFTLSATVRNDGDGASEATTLRYYRSTDTTISTSNTEIGTNAVAGIGVSGSSSESVEVTAQPTPGTYYYGACVDAVEDESDETNNCSSSVQIDVPEPEDQSLGSPDLTILAVSVSTSPGGTYPDGSFTLSATVRNDGDGASEATTLRYYRSTDTTITTSDTEVGTDAVASLGDLGNTSELMDLAAPSNPGTYHYGACVDAVEDESDETNNCSSSVQINVLESQNPPNLVVRSPSVSPSSPAPRARFTLSATVRNTGGGASTSTTLRYYRSTDATITTSDTPVGTDAVGALGAAGTSNESISVTAPSAFGTYYYGACVNAVAGESDTTNNCSSAVTVRLHRPDRVVDSPTASPSNPVAGTRYTFSVTMRNTGGGASGATIMRYYRSTDAPWDQTVGAQPVGALDPGGTSRVSISLTALSRPGTYDYRACVDTGPSEADASNNCSSYVTVTVLPKVDLVVGSPTVSNRGPVAGTAFTLSATVSNTGNGASASTTLRYYRSTDATITISDTSEGTGAVGALAPAGTSDKSISVTAPSIPGIYYYGACVDTVASEPDTTNNCSSSVRVTVLSSSPGPDLVVGSPTVSAGRPVVGASFTLSATVINLGSGASTSTTLRYYRSTDATITISDTSEGTGAVGALAAAGTSNESISVTAPSSPGAYYYGACVDAVTDESDTTDNCSSAVRVTVLLKPDLVVSSYASSNSLSVGYDFTLSAWVKNAGGGPSSATTRRYYRSEDETITTSDKFLGSKSVRALDPEEISRLSISLLPPLSRGTYYYGTCVDAVANESDTTNNCSSSVTVTVR